MLTTFFLNPFRRISSYFLTLGELTKNFRHLCDYNIKENNIQGNDFGDPKSLEKLLSAKYVIEKLLQSIDENMQMETILYSQVKYDFPYVILLWFTKKGNIILSLHTFLF